MQTNFDDEDFSRRDCLYCPPPDYYQLQELKRILAKVSGPERADLLFQLAEIHAQKSKVRAHLGFKDFSSAYDRWAERKACGYEPGPEPRVQQYMRQAEIYRAEALRRYDEILKDYPSYDRRDEVLFAAASSRYELGQHDEALALYNQLIEQFPKSKFVADAYVNIGEHYLAASKSRDAQVTKPGAIEGFPAATPEQAAILKLVSDDLAAEKHQHALDTLMRIAKEPDRSNGLDTVRRAAAKAMILPLVKTDAGARGVASIQQMTSSREPIAQYADALRAAGQFGSAIDVYRGLVADAPSDPACPDYELEIYLCHRALGLDDAARVQARRIVDTYGANSAWAKANASNAVALAGARELVDSAAQDIASDADTRARRGPTAPEGPAARVSGHAPRTNASGSTQQQPTSP